MVSAMGCFVVVVVAIGLVVVVATGLVVAEEFLVAATRADEVLLEPIVLVAGEAVLGPTELEVGGELQGEPMGCFVEVLAEAEAVDVVAG
jgi:hypothetical protein